MKLLFIQVFLALAILEICYGQTSLSKSTGPPAFFLQDPTDGLCISGSTYKRCSINTLWYVSGKPGTYRIHQRPINDDEDESLCLSKSQCHLESAEIQLTNCNHCGAKKWNIIGDAETGYVLTENNNKNCINRNATSAFVARCDKGYSTFSLQFATKDDIDAMSSDGAKLIVAASDNDMETVSQLISSGVNVNSRDWDNLTAVIAASGKGHTSIVQFLLENKADVNARDKDNITAVMEATIGGHFEILKILGDSGADLDCYAASGVSPLWLASGDGRKDLVEYFIAAKANPNNSRIDGITALMAASSGGHTEIVESLLKTGADVHAKDNEGLTALISACENGSFPIVSLLLQFGSDVNLISSNGFSPLIIASAHGHSDVVKALLENGAEIDMEHPEGITALMYASAGGYPDTVKLLIKSGANVNQKHKQGGSAIMEASTAGNMTVFAELLSAGADPFVIDNDGVTTLMSAASQGHLEIVKLLLEKGVKINHVANSGGTAIMFAAGSGHNETTKFLIEKGADVNIVVEATPEYIEQVAKAISEGKTEVEPHKDGVTALMVAAEGGHFGTVKLLVEANAAINVYDDEDMSPLLNAIKGKYFDIAIYLINKGADSNQKFIDEKGKEHNLLMDAIISANNDLAVTLIENGANCSYLDADQVSLLTQASYLGNSVIVSKLLSFNVDVNVANIEGISPLIAAASEGHIDVINLLIGTKTVDINHKDKDGTTALMAASVRGHLDVIKVLLENGADVNAQNIDGHSALMFAYNGKNQVETLLEKYKDYIMESQDNSTEIIKEALQSHINVISVLTRFGADPNLKDLEGHIAADFDHKVIVNSDGEVIPSEISEL